MVTKMGAKTSTLRSVPAVIAPPPLRNFWAAHAHLPGHWLARIAVRRQMADELRATALFAWACDDLDMALELHRQADRHEALIAEYAAAMAGAK
jgi:hypothetical protein